MLSPSGVLRILLGVPFLMFLPGYSCLAALFPRREGLTTVERVALSSLLSMAIVALVGLVLSLIWEISLYPILISIALFSVAVCGIAYHRRRRLAPQDRFEPQIRLRMPQLDSLSGRERMTVAILSAMVIISVAALVYVATRSRSGERFTEFYLLGSSGMVSDYPSAIVLGTHENVTIGVTNREGKDVTYRIRVALGTTDLQTIDGLALEDGDNWERIITLTPTTIGDSQKVEFLLYRGAEPEPYHQLNLWIDVRDPSISPSTP